MVEPKPSAKYDAEISKLGETYELALQQELTGLCAAIAAASESSVIGVGSGGSYTVASLLCNLHETYTGRVSRTSTPLELICNPNLASTSPVFLISAEGKNPDILEALMRVRFQSARSIHIITNRAESLLTEKANKISEVTTHVFNLGYKDGFLATNSLLLDAVLVAKAYAELDRAPSFPRSIDQLTISGATPDEWVKSVDPLIQQAIDRRSLFIDYRPSAIEAMKFGTLGNIRDTKIPFKVEVFPNDPAPIIRPVGAESENAGHFEWSPAQIGYV